ncbi:hypothetical protein [Lysobacter sp. A3-1-A15]|uniref:hypothetical protein n=1 Tax=Novilysobacter viscosus TaxID=3098602 RepID=UPI002ED8E9FB
MEFRIDAAGAVPDLTAIEDALRAFDPAAMVDVQASTSVIRVAATINEHELLGMMQRLGLPVTAASIERVPSVCCGGCSG